LLRRHRLASGLTQELLAARAGLSTHGIQKLEHGTTRPYRATVQRLATARQALPKGVAAAAWAAGREMRLDRAIAHALAPSELVAAAASTATEPRAAQPAGQLTAREREVAALVARGNSNRQIGAALVITERTVAAHIEHMLNKLGFTSRTQIGVWAVEHPLVASSPA
jgi:DNA-binding NarL/FixJ family response regulator